MANISGTNMTTQYTVEQINRLPSPEFITVLGGIFEHSPWVAESASQQRPFDSISDLQKSMFAIVLAADETARLLLIRNHPQLAGKEADEGTLTEDSQKEQSRAGLNQCSAEELELLRNLNKQYLDKFSFPFVIAVSGLNKYQIIEAMQQRLKNDKDNEFATSINEIGKIASIRLNALIDG